jgi:hypothetical protein
MINMPIFLDLFKRVRSTPQLYKNRLTEVELSQGTICKS